MTTKKDLRPWGHTPYPSTHQKKNLSFKLKGKAHHLPPSLNSCRRKTEEIIKMSIPLTHLLYVKMSQCQFVPIAQPFGSSLGPQGRSPELGLALAACPITRPLASPLPTPSRWHLPHLPAAPFSLSLRHHLAKSL